MDTKNLQHYFLNEGKNCAEAVFLAAADKYGLDISDDAKKAVGVFGGGIGGCERLCGAAAGAVCAIGVKYNTGNAHSSPEMTERTKEFMVEFTKEYGSDLCKDIKPIHKHPELRCLSVVEKSFDILEKYMIS